jgi:hypothetical protein
MAPGFIQLCVWATIAHKMNQNAKKDTTAKHEEQKQSPEAKANTVDWSEWVAKATPFINSAGPSFKEKRDALIVACYTFQPPVRNDWASMKFTDTVPTEQTSNFLLVNEKEVVAFWGQFKNRSSFKNELPVRIPIENEALANLFRQWKKQNNKNNSAFVFPTSDRINAKAFSNSAFGTHLGNLTDKIVGKRFTTQRMRVSFITNYHKTAVANGEIVNLAETKKVMRQLHQKSVSVHLSYAKFEKEIEKMMVEAGMMTRSKKAKQEKAQEPVVTVVADKKKK